ncbi:hypothetical protein B0I35DRAFT_482107 [Stachybotrys elegans]|uniref:BTB domain-containing protein n=1 Tax=Stachybotrys elegans TaxID=80388 RepID=A0A8K0SNW5_9HYPO|nr:hypothetical protein B0I35DRAFT_482107 [Stachybotrys elegans]
MAKKKIRKATKPVDAACRTDEIDTRPESSPYAASQYTIRTKHGTNLAFPSPLLRKCPKLQSLFSLWNSTLQLEISSDVGHALVHYFFTDTYQSLKPKGSTSDERLIDEFTTCIQVYSLARKYDIHSLEELVKREMDRLGNEIPFSKTLDILRSAYPNPSASDAWLGGYLKSGLQSVFQNSSETSDFLDCLRSGTESNFFSVSDLLFMSLVELVRTGTTLPQDPDAALQLEPLEDHTLTIQADPDEASRYPSQSQNLNPENQNQNQNQSLSQNQNQNQSPSQSQNLNPENQNQNQNQSLSQSRNQNQSLSQSRNLNPENQNQSLSQRQNQYSRQNQRKYSSWNQNQ